MGDGILYAFLFSICFICKFIFIFACHEHQNRVKVILLISIFPCLSFSLSLLSEFWYFFAFFKIIFSCLCKLVLNNTVFSNRFYVYTHQTFSWWKPTCWIKKILYIMVNIFIHFSSPCLSPFSVLPYYFGMKQQCLWKSEISLLRELCFGGRHDFFLLLTFSRFSSSPLIREANKSIYYTVAGVQTWDLRPAVTNNPTNHLPRSIDFLFALICIPEVPPQLIT